MYFAYGWPKVANTNLQPGDTYIYLKATEKYFFAVSRTCVQLWNGGLYRIRLSECVRSEEDVKQEGIHLTALWSPAKSTLAILTSENYLHLYAIHTWKDNLLHPSSNVALKDIPKVDIYLKSSIRMDSAARALSLTGDSRLLLVGFADGTVASLSWSGKMKEVAYPLDDATDLDGFYPGAAAEVDSRLRTPLATPPPEPPPPQQPKAGDSVDSLAEAESAARRSTGGGSAFAAVANTGPYTGGMANGYSQSYSAIPQSQLSRAIVQMSYCEHSKQVVMVLADGACAVCGTSESGLSPLSELCFGRWLCEPQRQAVYAQVGAQAQLIAVGLDSGNVELYRLHRTAIGSPGPVDGVLGAPPRAGLSSLEGLLGAGVWEPPVRTLTLESWGHKVQQTGSVAQVEWSPDGRALAVAYAGQGVVVWSPSGCRLMCSMRQPPPSLSTFPSTASRSIISHQASVAGRQPPLGQDSYRSLNQFGRASGALQRGVSAGLAQPPQVPLDGGISALSWGPIGYQLAVAEVGGGAGITGGSGGSLLEVLFAHSLPGHHRVARGGLGTNMTDEEMHVLLGHDRLLLIREAGEAAIGVLPWAGDGAEPAVGQVGDLTVSHVPVPHSYVASNWPLQQCAISASGSDIAVSGRNGLAVYNRTMERWRLFGDISQERQVSCRALGWLASGVLVACSGPDPNAPPALSPTPAGPLGVGGAAAAAAPGCTGNELLLLPRYHLDLTSLLARHPLQQPPIAMDCLGSHILLASEPLEITLLEVTLYGDLSPTGDPRAIVTTLREISMFDVGRHLSDVALVPLLPVVVGAPGGAKAAAGAPRQCVLLRWGGLLSVLDLEKGAEMTLATEIEAFWLSDAITCQAGVAGAVAAEASRGPSAHELEGASMLSSAFLTAPAEASAAAGVSTATLDVEMPWWLYGPAGMQLCFPSSLGATPMSGSVGPKEGHDIELEFDQEVYPVGISLADDAIIGITQRIVRGSAGLAAGGNMQVMSPSQLPCFHPIPESQPVLPCLLRRLLQRGAFQEAVSLARRHARGPHFARSLEWLLFTALEIDTTTASSSQARPASITSARGSQTAALTHQPSLKQLTVAGAQPSLLAAAAELVRHFPNLFAEVVVSVARKTDAALWPPLFDAVGSPSRLLDGLVEAGELASAACFLLIIDRLEGAAAAHAQALRLMHSSLGRGQYPLCCELLRFVVPPADNDVDGRGLGSGISVELSADGLATPSAPATARERSGPEVAAQQPTASAAANEPALAKAWDAAGGRREEDEAPQQQQQQREQQQGGRTWLGWLLGYSADPEEQLPQQQEERRAKEEELRATAPLAPAAADAGFEAPGPLSRVQQTLASGAGRPGPPASPARSAAASTSGAGGGSAPGVPSNPALAQLLLTGAASGGRGEATAKAACKLVAEHAWGLLEAGHVAALGQLLQASSFLPGGLVGLMNQFRESPYAVRGYKSHTALELLSALALAVSELPVWSSEEVEAAANGVEALCREVGAEAWAVAMAVLLVDAGTVTAFKQREPEVWAQFVQMLHADSSFSYLWEIVEVLSDGLELSASGKPAPVPPGAAVAGVERVGREAGSGQDGGGVGAVGSPTASAGRVELWPMAAVTAVSSEIEEGPRTPSAAIPGTRTGEVSIARG